MRIEAAAVQKTITILFSVAGLLMIPTAVSAAEAGHGPFQATHSVLVQYPYPYGWGYPGYWGPYYYYDTRGKIKIRDENEFDQVYINGAYAGTVGKRKTIRLEPGRYNIEVRRQEKELVKREVYILTQKTLEIHVP